MVNRQRIDFTEWLKRVDELIDAFGEDRAPLTDDEVRHFYNLGLPPAVAFDCIRGVARRRRAAKAGAPEAEYPARKRLLRSSYSHLHN
jgi:hypothetical protein